MAPKRDCDLCMRLSIPEKTYEKLDECAPEGALIICRSCRMDNLTAEVIDTINGVYLIRLD